MSVRRSLDRRHLLAVALAVLFVGGTVLGSPVGLLRSLATMPDATFVVALAAVYVVRPFTGFPLSPLSVLVGYRYGLPGVGLVLAGTVLTCVPPYLAGRYLREDGGLLGRLAGYGDRAFDRTGDFSGVLAARLSPAPADPVSYGAGLSAVRVPAFVAGTVAGEVPWAVAFVSLGASLSALSFDRVDPPGWLGLVLAGLAVGVIAYALVRE